MTNKLNETRKDIENRINESLMWLGYEDVEFVKRFSASQFEEGKKKDELFECEITYNYTGDFLPKSVATNLVTTLEKILNYHIKSRNFKDN